MLPSLEILIVNPRANDSSEPLYQRPTETLWQILRDSPPTPSINLPTSAMMNGQLLDWSSVPVHPDIQKIPCPIIVKIANEMILKLSPILSIIIPPMNGSTILG